MQIKPTKQEMTVVQEESLQSAAVRKLWRDFS